MRHSLRAIMVSLLLVTAVLGCGKATPTATVAPTLPPSATPAPTAIPATPTPEPPACPPDSRFVADITVPDDTVVAPGAPFTKSWLLQNTGSCSWPSNAQLNYVSGEQMGAASAVPVPPISAGQTVTVSVDMTAPTTPGTYEGRWQICYGNECFGSTIWVRIISRAD